MRSIREARAKLPAAQLRDDILAAVDRHRVLVVSGATGCGKSTQVCLPGLAASYGASSGL